MSRRVPFTHVFAAPSAELPYESDLFRLAPASTGLSVAGIGNGNGAVQDGEEILIQNLSPFPVTLRHAAAVDPLNNLRIDLGTDYPLLPGAIVRALRTETFQIPQAEWGWYVDTMSQDSAIQIVSLATDQSVLLAGPVTLLSMTFKRNRSGTCRIEAPLGVLSLVGLTATFQLLLDGAVIRQEQKLLSATLPLSTTLIVPQANYAAGDHTILLRWGASVGTMTCNAATGAPNQHAAISLEHLS